LIPWHDITVAARRGPYEYSDPAILRFAKASDVGAHISGRAMDELLRIGLQFRIANDGQVVSCETISETKTTPS
jgi:hypothetical protein